MKETNVILIGIDTLRADHLSCYGYFRKTSPNIDRLAKDSVVFTSAYATGIPTHPGWTTILTGVHPLVHGIVSHVGTRKLSHDIPMVQEVLRTHGYRTGAVDNMFLKYGSFYDWFTRGFHIYSHPGAIPVSYAGLKVQANNVTERGVEVLGELLKEGNPFFLFLHYWDPHAPYKPPEPFNKLFWNESIEKRFIREGYEKEEILDYLISQYDGEIAYVDSEIGRFIEYLEDRGVLDESLVIITSDHGENLKQHEGYLQHHGLYETITHIPLIVRFPEGTPSGTVNSLVQHTDIVATIYDVVGVEPRIRLYGRSLRKIVEGLERGWNEILMIENTHQKSIALRRGAWKLIYYLEKSYGGFPAGYIQLFNIERDPYELVNLAFQEPELTLELKSRLDHTLKTILQGRPNPLDQPITRRRVEFYSEATKLVEKYGFTIRRD